MPHLSPADHSYLKAVIFAVESAISSVLPPEKINIAISGKQASHWHLFISRWTRDSYFPKSCLGTIPALRVTRAQLLSNLSR